MHPSDSTPRTLVKLCGVTKHFLRRHHLMGKGFVVRAVDGVDLEIRQGQTLALVGPSGSGKSTLARCVLRLEAPTSGQIWFDGVDIVALGRNQLRKLRPRMQLVFQDAARAMNPRLPAADIVAEPLRIQKRGTLAEQRHRAVELMERVGLSEDMADRSPLEMSGGQRQRLAIARALALAPQLIVLDEALSALDRIVQAQIANLLLELQRELHLTYLLIAHDLNLADHLADEIAVMSSGRIVARAATPEVTSQALLVALLAAQGAIATSPREPGPEEVKTT